MTGNSVDALVRTSHRLRRALTGIERNICAADPHLARLFLIFTRLADGDDMPRTERLTTRAVRRAWRRAWVPEIACLLVALAEACSALAIMGGGRLRGCGFGTALRRHARERRGGIPGG